MVSSYFSHQIYHSFQVMFVFLFLSFRFLLKSFFSKCLYFLVLLHQRIVDWLLRFKTIPSTQTENFGQPKRGNQKMQLLTIRISFQDSAFIIVGHFKRQLSKRKKNVSIKNTNCSIIFKRSFSKIKLLLNCLAFFVLFYDTAPLSGR